MTGISPEEAECGDHMVTVPGECGGRLKAANVSSVSVAVTSDTAHEGKKTHPFSLEAT